MDVLELLGCCTGYEVNKALVVAEIGKWQVRDRLRRDLGARLGLVGLESDGFGRDGHLLVI